MSEPDRLVAGRYRIGERLGSGAMGVVWQAHDERLHRTVAVKQLLLQPGLSQSQAQQARERALREGRIAARLQHANAVTVHDVVTDDGDPWLVMEYLPSASLATVLAERETLPPHEVADLGAQAAAALAAAHAAGIVHRDIKPGNVLLGDDGVVKITDFGISKAIGDVTVTATGMLAGTPAYLAPELAKGEQPTPASDVFSLGSTLYTAVEGNPPFGREDNPLALLHTVAAGRLSPPHRAGPLTAVLMSLLRLDPAERPTMAKAKEALGLLAAGRRVPAALLNVPGPENSAAITTPVARPAPQQQRRATPPGGMPRPASEPSLPPATRQWQQREPTGQQPVPRPAGAFGGPAAAQPGRSSGPDPAPRYAGSAGVDVRQVALYAVAILLAVLVGIGVAEFFLP